MCLIMVERELGAKYEAGDLLLSLLSPLNVENVVDGDSVGIIRIFLVKVILSVGIVGCDG